jgi:hypothetical protein
MVSPVRLGYRDFMVDDESSQRLDSGGRLFSRRGGIRGERREHAADTGRDWNHRHERHRREGRSGQHYYGIEWGLPV